MATIEHVTHDKDYDTSASATDNPNGAQRRENGANASQLGTFAGQQPYGHCCSAGPRKLANPAPMGLCAFALTTFVLSLLNFSTHGVSTPNIIIASAFGYGGLVQLLAGMWYVLQQAAHFVTM